MGWTQDTVWNNAFAYAFPISFIGSICYGLLAIAQVDPINVIGNRNWLMAFNLFFGISGLVSLGVWLNIDLSSINVATSYVDLDVTRVKDAVKRS
jgi:hypothetical protein